jgi:hypothetical protein
VGLRGTVAEEDGALRPLLLGPSLFSGCGRAMVAVACWIASRHRDTLSCSRSMQRSAKQQGIIKSPWLL